MDWAYGTLVTKPVRERLDRMTIDSAEQRPRLMSKTMQNSCLENEKSPFNKDSSNCKCRLNKTSTAEDPDMDVKLNMEDRLAKSALLHGQIRPGDSADPQVYDLEVQTSTPYALDVFEALYSFGWSAGLKAQWAATEGKWQEVKGKKYFLPAVVDKAEREE